MIHFNSKMHPEPEKNAGIAGLWFRFSIQENNLSHALLMHQSFATTSPSGPGNSGDIDFSLSKARVYAQHCRDTLMFKALPKSPLKSRQVNVNFHGHFGTGIKTPAIPRHCGDNAEVKTLQLSPAMPPLFPAPRGPWLQMTGA